MRWIRKTASFIKNIFINYWLLILGGILLAAFKLEGFFAFAFFIYFYALYKIWVFRKQVAYTRKYIESFIWGKPLQKDMWDKGELKNTKVKVVWGKKKDAKDQN